MLPQWLAEAGTAASDGPSTSSGGSTSSVSFGTEDVSTFLIFRFYFRTMSCVKSEL